MPLSLCFPTGEFKQQKIFLQRQRGSGGGGVSASELCNSHLRHDDTDVIDALDNSLAATGDGDGSLSAVGQHLTGHLDTGSSHLTDLLDLAASLPYQAPALAGRDDQSEGDGRTGNSPGGDQIVEVLAHNNI